MSNIDTNFNDSDKTATHTDNAPSLISTMAIKATTKTIAMDGKDIFFSRSKLKKQNAQGLKDQSQ